MKTVTTTSGTGVELDGDLMAVVEAVSLDFARRRELEYDYEDVVRECTALVSQMSVDDLRTYLIEGLVMTFLHYEHERMATIVKKANRAVE